MSMTRTLTMVGALAVLGACTTPIKGLTEVDALNQAQAVGSPFTSALTDEYRAFVNSEFDIMKDYPDSLHFARKGLAAASGEVVLPEPIGDWNLTVTQMQELGSARGSLINAFNLGARETAPTIAAKAQVLFDCWIEQAEENWQQGDIKNCRTGFGRAMNEISSITSRPIAAPVVAPTPVPVGEPLTGVPIDPSQPMAAQNAMFLVFFDWDSTDLDGSGRKVLDAVAEEILRNNPVRIEIVGHADTSGPEEYNETLANRRAASVRAYLQRNGVDAGRIQISSRGENDLLVPTADNVREPANRRANISFQ